MASPHRDAGALFVALLLVTACSGQGVVPPVNDDLLADEALPPPGVPDRGQDIAVVGIDMGGGQLCTGALVAPDVVLTAPRCIFEREAAPKILVGDDRANADVRATGFRILTPAASPPTNADIAAVLLLQPIDGVEPLAPREHGVKAGDHVRSVAFAPAGGDLPGATKLVREHVEVLSADGGEFSAGESPCRSSAGGPALDEATGELVGLVSRAGPTCDNAAAQDVFTRTELFLGFIEQAILAARVPGAPGVDAGHALPRAHKPRTDVGHACLRAADCAAGVCVTASGSQYCSRTCTARDRCPSTYRCAKPKQGDAVCVQKQ
jgi:hypothetical protein